MTERNIETTDYEKRPPAKLPLIITKPTAPPPSLPPTLIGKPRLPPPPLPTLQIPKITPEIFNKDEEESSADSADPISPSNASNHSVKKGSLKMKPVKITPFKALLSIPAAKPQAKKRENKSIAEIFNEDSQSEDEDMPPEAKMRMRNIGKNTPVPSGPNSFNKGKLGFCNTARIFEKNLEEAVGTSDDAIKNSNHKNTIKNNWNKNVKRVN